MPARFSADHLPGRGAVVLGVSGGPDSLCLLDLARQTGSLEITVAHFNHRLRPESDQECETVRGLAQGMGLAFVTDSADVRSFAGQNGLALEEAARLLRYRFLFAQAHQRQACAVAVGHTADDQVETVLMHLLRGAGLAGLKGMAGYACPNEFDREIPLVRPILHLWRAETESYCREHGLQPILDPSNQDPQFLRNRLRHNLIPELEKYNPRFKVRLLRTAEALAGDYGVVQDAIDRAWREVVQEQAAQVVVFRASSLAALPAGLLRNLVRRGMEALRPNLRNLDFNTLQRAVEFIAGRTDAGQEVGLRAVDLTGGLLLRREADSIFLMSPQTELPGGPWPQIETSAELEINHTLSLEQGSSISAFEVDIQEARRSAEHNPDAFSAWLDADRTGDRFSIRARRPGDRFQCLGMDGHTIKLSDLFINVKLPERARGKWPLVTVGGEIAWVPGFRLAHPFRITPATKRAVKLTLQKKQGHG